MVATTRHRKRESPSQSRRTSSAADENAPARGRRGASHDHGAPQSSIVEKSKGKSSRTGGAAVAHTKALGGTRGRPRVSGVRSGSDDEDDNNQGIFPAKKQKALPPKINEEVGSDSDDAPEEVSKGAAQQIHEQAAAAIRMASKPDLAAKRAEKDRLRAATQAAQAAASRRKAADAAALEELPQDVLNAAAAVTLTLQQSLAAPRTNHIPLLPEIPKKVTSRVVHGFHVSHLQSERLSDVVTSSSVAASKSFNILQNRLHRQGIVRRPLGGIKRQGPSPAFGGAHCVVR